MEFINRFTAENGYTPTNDQVQQGMGFSTRIQAYNTIDRLSKKGFLKKIPRKGFIVVSPVTTTRVRLAIDEFNFIDIPREMIPDESVGMELVKWKEKLLVVSKRNPKNRELALMISPIYEIDTLGTYIGNNRFISSDGKLYGASPDALRRVLFVLQPVRPSL